MDLRACQLFHLPIILFKETIFIVIIYKINILHLFSTYVKIDVYNYHL